MKLKSTIVQLRNVICAISTLSVLLAHSPAYASDVEYITNCSGGRSGPNKVFVNGTGQDLIITPWFDKPGVLAAAIPPNSNYAWAIEKGQAQAFAFCGMKSIDWARRDLNIRNCGLPNQPWSSTLCGIQNTPHIRRYSGPNDPKGWQLRCPRQEFARGVNKLPNWRRKLPPRWGIEMKYLREWVKGFGDVVGAGGFTYKCAGTTKVQPPAKPKPRGTCEDGKNNNNNPVQDFVDLRDNLNVNPNLYTKAIGSRDFAVLRSFPGADVNGYVEAQNLRKLYGQGVFETEDYYGIEVDKARHVYEFPYTMSHASMAKTGGALGLQIRATARPGTPCGNQVQSFEVYHKNTRGQTFKVAQVNINPRNYVFVHDFRWKLFTPERGKGSIIIKERSSCRQGNFSGGAVITRLFVGHRDPACNGPSGNENNLPQCRDLVDNDGDGRIDHPQDPGCSSSGDNRENDEGQCIDGKDNDGDGDVDWPKDPGCSGPNDNSENSEKECNDGRDNDSDGKIDHPKDPGCESPTDNNETDKPDPKPECNDGVDNDNDGKVDFPDDYGCSNKDDNNEGNDPQCSDGEDNDNDGKIDFPEDPGCSGPKDNNETDPAGDPECSDGLDNDNDGKTDFPDDYGCSSNTDDDESNDPDCSDGIDNDNDGKIDFPEDPGCSGPKDNNETDPAGDPECSDGADNDHDGKTDYPEDPGCSSENDDDESDDPECSDGVDNDSDGKIDYPNDPGCDSERDDSENSDGGGNNGELKPLVSCIDECNAGHHLVHLGAINTTGSKVTISVGSFKDGGNTNRYRENGQNFTPAGAATMFEPGTIEGSFSVGPIDLSNKPVWQLGINNETDSVVLSTHIPVCAETYPVFVKCENGQATFGIYNAKYFDPTYQIGDLNTFSPGNADRGQGTKFFDGQIVTVDAQVGDTWTLGTQTAEVTSCN